MKELYLEKNKKNKIIKNNKAKKGIVVLRLK